MMDWMFRRFAGETTGSADCNLTGQVSGGRFECDTGLPNVAAGGVQFQQILQILFGVLAVVSVLMIVLAGIRMMSDGNNPQEVAKARNTIIYAVAGLVIAVTAEFIIAFLLNRL